MIKYLTIQKYESIIPSGQCSSRFLMLATRFTIPKSHWIFKQLLCNKSNFVISKVMKF